MRDFSLIDTDSGMGTGNYLESMTELEETCFNCLK